MRGLPDSELFSRADARELGWSDSALTRAVRSGRLRSARRGLHAAHELNQLDRIVAAARACSNSVISHRSAVLLQGLPLLDNPPARIDLTVCPRGTGDTSGALVHRAHLWPSDVMLVDGIAVTTVARTLVDLARSIPLGASIVTIDAALNRGLVDYPDLSDVLQRCAGWPFVRRASRAVERSDLRAESPLESVSRLIIDRLRIPRPELQVDIRNARGRLLGRADFYWDEFGVVGEADGRAKYDDRSVLIEEKLRQEAMENTGLVAVRWGWSDVQFRQVALGARLRAAFARGRLRDESGFPRQWSVKAH